ncbi:T9SS type A sorting domain-containing protein [bacterium]|nr:T9SS type A sorting domain-containing protein [bacterium]MBU1983039.1 T9SS type A sorting domain-containing protein [bacterium]
MKRAILLGGLLLLVASYAPAETFEAGSTYLSSQHNGSCGRMIGVGVDDMDDVYVNIVWMRRTTETRHVYYNVFDPVLEQFVFTLGAVVNASQRAGYACLAQRADGWCFPAFHQITPNDPYGHSAAAMDFLCGLGAFTTTGPAWIYRNSQSVEIIWPKIAADRNGDVHVVSAENPASGLPDEVTRLYYSKGTPLFDTEGAGIQIEWESFGGVELVLFDSSYTLAHNIACSRTSDRVARAWLRPPEGRMNPENRDNCDVFVQFSEDAGLNWGLPVNITQFIQPDSACWEATNNPRCCDRDTIRPYNELSLIFDDADDLHLAFTTVGYYYFPESEDHERMRPHQAIIWHWSEQTDSFRTVAAFWVPDSLLTVPTFGQQTLVGRPSLSLDTTSGYLYCAYYHCDTTARSAAGIPNADVFVSVSTDLGNTWSIGTNVTNTTPPPNAPYGENLNERDVTAAEFVFMDRLHLSYVLDQDAGTSQNGSSRNPMIYHRVSIDSLATIPLLRTWPFHVDVVECDTISSAETPPTVAREFRLYPPYPNPFNSTATIRFDLPRAMEMELLIHDVLGRRVDVLGQGRREVGSHSISWRAESLASGVYFVTLRAEGRAQMQKILLVR